uniref:Uncharacterized protein n=1 Tax=Glossina palpalis gambiensis TaxID=67801 RepID=A0A1B0B1G3_9MUSC
MDFSPSAVESNDHTKDVEQEETNHVESDNHEENDQIGGEEESPVVFVHSDSGEVRIHLGGSHITATDTETAPKESKNVKFHEELEQIQGIDADLSTITILAPEAVSKSNWIKTDNTQIVKTSTSTGEPSLLFPRRLWSADDVTLKIQKPLQLEKVKLQQKCTQLELKQIEEENGAIAKRFEKIMEMFDTFTKNLESLEPTQATVVASPRRKYRHDGREKIDKKDVHPKVHISRYADFHSQLEKKLSVIKLNEEAQSTASFGNQTAIVDLTPKYKDIAVATSNCNISTAASAVPISCQTSFHENISTSLGLSSLNPSASTSKSGLQNSLNNFTNADAALLINSQAHLIKCDLHRVDENGSKEKLIKVEGSHITPGLEPVMVEQPCSQQFHTIHIEAASSPPSSDLRRAPLCSRIWNSICDFCAAICMCLQVNRDCIFCLGFFAAFVVSASFLTAFFYRTLSVTSPMQPTPPQRHINQNSQPLKSFINEVWIRNWVDMGRQSDDHHYDKLPRWNFF